MARKTKQHTRHWSEKKITPFSKKIPRKKGCYLFFFLFSPNTRVFTVRSNACQCGFFSSKKVREERERVEGFSRFRQTTADEALAKKNFSSSSFFTNSAGSSKNSCCCCYCKRLFRAVPSEGFPPVERGGFRRHVF